MARDPSTRCRLVLILPPLPDAARVLAEALAGGDVASVIMTQGSMDDASYQTHCEPLLKLAQEAGAAALMACEPRIAARTTADGVFIEAPREDARDVVARFSPHKIVGFGGAKERHRALELGEANPEFMFFGKTDGDIRPEPHPKNLALAEWWSHLVEIPCVVMGGSAIESVVECAASGAEFVALGLAVVSCTDGPREAVRRANELLDLNAPDLSAD
ncbi:MAG TPA: thiamine phosphate synthase [Rhizobiaceae bacterium]|nr:thiamine phosphate synthase [Rhizobiaceae bacterium]